MRSVQPAVERRPRVFYGWRIVAASFVTNLTVSATYWQGFQIFFLPMLKEFGWSRTALSGAFTMRQLEGGIVAPVAGFLVDRLGPRRIISAGAAIFGLGMVALSQVSSLWTFYLFFLIAGIGTTGTSHTVTWPVLISRWFRRKRGRAMGIGTSGPVLSGLPILLTAWLVLEYGWRPVMLFTGFAVWLIIIPVALSVRNAPEPYGLLPDGDTPDDGASSLANGDPGATTAAASEVGYTVGQALRDRTFWIVVLYFGALFLGISGFSVHQVPYFESLGLSPPKAAVTLTFVMLMSGVGRLGFGFLSDRLDIRLVLGTVVILNAAAWLYLIVVDVSSLAGALPFTVLFGIPFGASVVLRPLLMIKLYGTKNLGALNGLMHAGPLVGGMIGPLLMGRVFDVTGDYTQSVYVFAVVTALVLPVAFLVRNRPLSPETVRPSPASSSVGPS